MNMRTYELISILAVFTCSVFPGISLGSEKATQCTNLAAYWAGTKIQKAVREKDLDTLFSFVDGELEYGPRRAFVKEKAFDDIFSDDWREAVLATEPACVALDGEYSLGISHVWYWVTVSGQPQIFSILGAAEEIPQGLRMPAWDYKGQPLKVACFTGLWRSNDNYEVFHKSYASDVEWRTFSKFIGRFLGREVPLDASLSPWPDQWGAPDPIHLSNAISDCQKEVGEEKAKELNLIYDRTYEVLREVPPSYCKALAPHLSAGCEKVALITVTGPYGYSVTNVNPALYGIVEDAETREAYVVPLINFDSEADALNYLEQLQARLAPSLPHPIVEFQTASFRVSIHIEDETLVYSAWSTSDAPDDEPDLVLTGGRWVNDGSMGNGFYSFTNGDYEYRITTSRAITSSTPPDALIVLRKTQKLLDEPIVSSSPAGFFYEQAPQPSAEDWPRKALNTFDGLCYRLDGNYESIISNSVSMDLQPVQDSLLPQLIGTDSTAGSAFVVAMDKASGVAMLIGAAKPPACTLSTRGIPVTDIRDLLLANFPLKTLYVDDVGMQISEFFSLNAEGKNRDELLTNGLIILTYSKDESDSLVSLGYLPPKTAKIALNTD